MRDWIFRIRVLAVLLTDAFRYWREDYVGRDLDSRMGWADNHIKALLAGDPVQFRPRGHSMAGKVESGSLVTVRPVAGAPQVGDVVLCKVHGRQYLHIIKAKRLGMFKIGNNRGGVNGWTPLSAIYGLMDTPSEPGLLPGPFEWKSE